MRHTIITLLLLLATNILYGQYQISGVVVDSNSKAAITSANIMLYHNGQMVAFVESDAAGVFVVEGLSAGDYELLTSAISYKDFSQALALSSSQVVDTIALEPSPVMVDDIQVRGKRRYTIYKLDKKVIDASSNIVASYGATAVDLLMRAPSVRIDGDGVVTFRGSTGFEVIINGRRSHYDAATALKQIPASQIENIEIISTPSARNRSDGDAGVINITLRKDSSQGVSGVVNGYVNTLGSRGGDVMLQHNKGRNQFSMTAIYAQQRTSSNFDQQKYTLVDDIATTSHSMGERDGEYFNYNMQLRWNHTREKTNYFAEFIGGYEGNIRDGDLAYSETQVVGSATPVQSMFNSVDHYDIDESLVAATVGFDHKFNQKDHTLAGYFYVKRGWDALEHFESDLFNLAGEREQGHRAWELEDRWYADAKLEYKLPYSASGRLEAGYEYNLGTEDGDYVMEYWNPQTQTFDYRDDIYNTFYFKRAVNTLYLLANQSLGNFEIQAGVRGERTLQILESSKAGADRRDSRFELFPSAHVAYSLDEQSQLTAAYSRRTNRPMLFYMEPYITFRDYYTASIGNPDIRPEYINAYEISYQRDISDGVSLQAAIFHRSREDKFERLRVPYQAGITLDSMANVGNDYSTGGELSLSYVGNGVYSAVANASLYHYKLVNNLPEFGGENDSSLNYDISISNIFRLTKNTSAQLDGVFVGPTVQTQGEQRAFFYADLAVRQSMFDGRLTANLAFRNFLNSAEYINNIDTYNLVSNTTITPKYPMITLGLGYVFNNSKAAGAKHRTTTLFEGEGH